MAEAFLESIGTAELLPQEYQRGYNTGYSSGYSVGYSNGQSASSLSFGGSVFEKTFKPNQYSIGNMICSLTTKGPNRNSSYFAMYSSEYRLTSGASGGMGRYTRTKGTITTSSAVIMSGYYYDMYAYRSGGTFYFTCKRANECPDTVESELIYVYIAIY